MPLPVAAPEEEIKETEVVNKPVPSSTFCNTVYTDGQIPLSMKPLNDSNRVLPPYSSTLKPNTTIAPTTSDDRRNLSPGSSSKKKVGQTTTASGGVLMDDDSSFGNMEFNDSFPDLSGDEFNDESMNEINGQLFDTPENLLERSLNSTTGCSDNELIVDVGLGIMPLFDEADDNERSGNMRISNPTNKHIAEDDNRASPTPVASQSLSQSSSSGLPLFASPAVICKSCNKHVPKSTIQPSKTSASQHPILWGIEDYEYICSSCCGSHKLSLPKTIMTWKESLRVALVNLILTANPKGAKNQKGGDPNVWFDRHQISEYVDNHWEVLRGTTERPRYWGQDLVTTLKKFRSDFRSKQEIAPAEVKTQGRNKNMTMYTLTLYGVRPIQRVALPDRIYELLEGAKTKSSESSSTSTRTPVSRKKKVIELFPPSSKESTSVESTRSLPKHAKSVLVFEFEPSKANEQTNLPLYVYGSMTAAVNELGISMRNIKKACEQPGGGYLKELYFIFVNDYNQLMGSEF